MDTVEVYFRGTVESTVVQSAVDQLRGLLRLRQALWLIIDCTAVEQYDPGVRGPGAQLLKVAREGGIHGGACIAPGSAVRMMGAAVAFVSSMPFDFVATRDEALRAIRERRNKASLT